MQWEEFLKNKARSVLVVTVQESELIFRNLCSSGGLDVLRIFLAYAANMNMIVYPMDVKTTFLNGILREEVNVNQPKGFVETRPFESMISQSPRGIFLNQSKYALESLKKYGMKSSDPVDTPMVEKSKLDEDTTRESYSPTHYGPLGIQRFLMPLTAYATLTHRERIEFLINKLGMRSFMPETLKQLADEAEE
ncbi:retrovirus-related pol polyprotein from transposon TNT 1-94 [Tanacetum coccineum]